MSSTSSSASTTKTKKELPAGAAADNHDKNASMASEKIRRCCKQEETGGGRGGGDDCWENLPATAIHLVCLMAGDASALSFCATCKAYRTAQPPLRVLSVGFDDWEEKDIWQELLQNEFCIKIVEPKDGAHRVVEALSRHAGEITHLFMVAIHDYDYQKEWEKYYLLKGNIKSYGKNLTSLRALVIVQPPEGYEPYDDDLGINLDEPRENVELRDCALQLVRSTTETLKALKIVAQVKFDDYDAKEVMEVAGSSLHYLDLNVVPWDGDDLPYPVRTRGEERITVSLRRKASKRCTSLLAPAQIICHEHLSPWQPLYLEQPHPNWPDDERQAFFELHQQCLTPRCSEEDETSPPQWRRPEGCSGVWCGNLEYCAGAPYEPLDPACFASPLG